MSIDSPSVEGIIKPWYKLLMNSANATYQNGQVVLDGDVDWENGARLEVRPKPMSVGSRGTRSSLAAVLIGCPFKDEAELLDLTRSPEPPRDISLD